MKTRSFALIFAVSIFAALNSSSAYAQRSESLGVTLPFAFTTNGRTLPAGHYRIEPQGSTRTLWLIRNDDGHSRDFLLASIRTGTVDGKVQLTFHRYGGRHFLTGFKTSAYQITLPTSREEKDVRSSGDQLSQMRVIEVETETQGSAAGK